MTITSTDQESRIRECETEGVMFPRGLHQMVSYCYAMEGVPAYEWSAHAKIIDLQNAGDVEPFNCFGVNLSGLTTVEKRGECALIREQVERAIGAYNIFRAKYSPAHLKMSQIALACIARSVHMKLTSGRFKVDRSLGYVADAVHLSIRPNHNQEECTIDAIYGKHGVEQRNIYRDIDFIQRESKRMESRDIDTIRKRCRKLVKYACYGVKNMV